MFDEQEYRRRRDALRGKIRSGLILFPGNGYSPINYPSNAYRFRQDSNFLYFFGLENPGMVGVVDIEGGRDTIYADDLSMDDIIWMGPQPSVRELAARCGVQSTRPMRDLASEVTSALKAGRRVHFLNPYRGEQLLALSDLLGIHPRALGNPYREGLIKNRYIGRTFIMPGQATRKKSVRQKLNTIPSEFKGRNVLLVDDSIVRGTTSREIVDMVRESGANKIYIASAAPEVRYPNVYGIDMPTREELIAHNRTAAEIAREINADACVFQDLAGLEAIIRKLNPNIDGLDSSCFNGEYITGDIDEAYLKRLSSHKRQPENHPQPTHIDYNVSVDNSEE